MRYVSALVIAVFCACLGATIGGLVAVLLNQDPTAAALIGAVASVAAGMLALAIIGRVFDTSDWRD